MGWAQRPSLTPGTLTRDSCSAAPAKGRPGPLPLPDVGLRLQVRHPHAGRAPPLTQEGLGVLPKTGLCVNRVPGPGPPSKSNCGGPGSLGSPALLRRAPLRCSPWTPPTKVASYHASPGRLPPIIGPRVRGGGGGARTWRRQRWGEGVLDVPAWSPSPRQPPTAPMFSPHRFGDY